MAAQVYSFGVLLFEIFSRSEPFAGEDLATVLGQVPALPPGQCRVTKRLGWCGGSEGADGACIYREGHTRRSSLTRARTRAHTQTQTHNHARTQIHSHTHTHTHTHTYTHTHTHTHTNTHKHTNAHNSVRAERCARTPRSRTLRTLPPSHALPLPPSPLSRPPTQIRDKGRRPGYPEGISSSAKVGGGTSGSERSLERLADGPGLLAADSSPL